METFDYIERNFADIKSEISGFEEKYGHRIVLVAVTKSASDEEFAALCTLGIENIGENRPAELIRRGEIAKKLGKAPILHQIGSLQRNKVRLIIGDAALIHSLDSLRLAEELDRQAKKLGRRAEVLIEINSAKEESKGGIMPEDAEEFFLKLREFEGISLRGIMTMGPAGTPAEDMRPYFRLTKEIFDKLNTQYGFDGEGILSMGMSESYRVAIEEGATLVRVGRRLFEKR